jgi:hypothetical protein
MINKLKKNLEMVDEFSPTHIDHFEDRPMVKNPHSFLFVFFVSFMV